MEKSEKEKLEIREENTNQPIEQDYDAHKENPGPSKEAVVEKNEKGAGQIMRWLIPILVILMLVVYFFVYRKH
jgi:hypothetical protein